MLTDEKPDLSEELLMHFGVRGMKWGVRKRRADEGERKKFFTSRNKKIAAGAAVAIAGAAAVIFILGSRGKQPIPSLDEIASFGGKGKGGSSLVRSVSSGGSAVSRSANQGGGSVSRATSAVFRDPSPFHMQAKAGQLAHNQAMMRIGNQRLTELTWRDSARMKQLTRDMDTMKNPFLKNAPKPMSLDEIRKKLQDPNHVWEI